jgi:hypothetical protein
MILLATTSLVTTTSVESANQTNRSTLMLQMIYIQPAIALTAGILILLMPRLLSYIVALYLIAVGILGLLDNLKI